MLETCRWLPAGGGRLFRWAPLAAALAATYAIWRVRQYRRRLERRRRWNAAGRDVVVLHQFARATAVPNLSPFALKLETFLRMANIEYIVDSSKPLGPKGKCPWITLNGVDFTDSELIIDHLLTMFPAALPGRGRLTAAQHALGRSVQVALDEHTVLAMAAHRFLADRLRHLVPAMAPRYRRRFRLLRPLVVRVATGRFAAIGWDRGAERLRELMRRDLEALSELLGDRAFLLGNEPTPYDAAVFGQLAQLLIASAPEVQTLARQFTNLVLYFERVKTRYWPDWEQCLAP